MRVPHSPHNLRKVMPVASVKPSSDTEDFTMGSSNDLYKDNIIEKNNVKEQSINSSKSPTSRPPRPTTYTSKSRDGKYKVGVEASTLEKHREFFEKNDMDVSNTIENLKEGSTNTTNSSDKETFKLDKNTNNIAESMGNNGGFNRGRERTRVSAVQRLVERKLAQREKEKLRQREQDEKMRCTSVQNDLSSVHRRSASTNGCINTTAPRHRSRDRSLTRDDPRFLCSPDLSSYNSNLKDNAHNESSNNRNKTCRTNKENKYLANLLLRTSRSCDRLYGETNEATKTFITISAGKPTRIREQSPCKRDKILDQSRRTSTGSSISSGSSSDEEVSSPPIKVAKSFVPNFKTSSKPEQQSKRDVVLEKPAPLKSTGLLREFSFIKENNRIPEKESKVRKTSYTTEKTIQVNSESKNRRLSIDINILSKGLSSSPEDKFKFDHKRCNNSPTSDLPSTSSDLSINSSTSSSLNGSDISSNSSIDGSNHESSPPPRTVRSKSRSSDGTSENDNHLSKRRISLEQRFKARITQPTMFPAKDKQPDDNQQDTSPQPRLRERKKSKLSTLNQFTQFTSSRFTSNSSSDSSNSSNSSFQNHVESPEAYCYDVENIISKEGHKYQKVSVTTKSDNQATSATTNAVPRRRFSQGNLAHQNRLPKGPCPRRRKFSAPIHSNQHCDKFKEETEEEIYNHHETFGISSSLSGSKSNIFTNRSANNISYIINIDGEVDHAGDGITSSTSPSSKLNNYNMHENTNFTIQPSPKGLQNPRLSDETTAHHGSITGSKYSSSSLSDLTHISYTSKLPYTFPKPPYPFSELDMKAQNNNVDQFENIHSGGGSQMTNYLSFAPSLTTNSSPDDLNVTLENDTSVDINNVGSQAHNKSRVSVHSIEATDGNEGYNVSNYVVHCEPVPSAAAEKVTHESLHNNPIIYHDPESNIAVEKYVELKNWHKEKLNVHHNTPISDSDCTDITTHKRNIDNNNSLINKNKNISDGNPETTYKSNSVNPIMFKNASCEISKTSSNTCISKKRESNNGECDFSCCDSALSQQECLVKSNKTEESTNADPKLSYCGEKNSCRVYRSTSPPSRNLTPCTSTFIPTINSQNIHTKKQHEEEKVVSCCPEYFDGQRKMLDIPDYSETMLNKMPTKSETISPDIIDKNISSISFSKENENKTRNVSKEDQFAGSSKIDNDEEEPCPLLKLHRLKMLQQHRVMQQKPREQFEFQNDLNYSTTNIINQEERKSGLLKRRSSIISNTSNNYPDDDMQSVSTVSGSGINFFRNVVRKHGRSTKENAKANAKNNVSNAKGRDSQNKKECKDCESQFRQKVLIERLVSDTMLNKAWLAGGGLPPSRLAKEMDVSSDNQHDQCETNNNTGNLQNLSSLSTESNSNSNFSPSKGSSIGIMVSSISNASTSCESRCAAHQNLLTEPNFNGEEGHEDELQDCDSISSVPFNTSDVANVFDASGLADDEQSISNSTRSSVSMSTVSGSGLLFLRNYIKKKVAREQEKGVEKKPLPKWNEPRPNISQFFNSVPVPFPPIDQFYGPTYVLPDDVVFPESEDDRCRRQSYASTIADLLDTFDSEDSELRNLEWDDLEGDDDPMPEDIYNYYQLLNGIEQLGQKTLDVSFDGSKGDDDDMQNEGRVTVLDSTQYKTPIAGEEEEEERSNLLSKSFNISAVPYSAAELPGSYKEQLSLPTSFKESNGPSKEEAVKCLHRSISRAKSRHSGCSSQKSISCSTNFQSPLQNPNQQIDSRSSTVLYKTPSTTKSYSTTNLESLATEQNDDNYFSLSSSRFSNDNNSFVFQEPQSRSFNQFQTPPLAISSPQYKQEKRNSRLLEDSYNTGYNVDNESSDARKNSLYKNENNFIDTNLAQKSKLLTAHQPIVTSSDHSSLASLFSKNCGMSQSEDSDALSCITDSCLSPQAFEKEAVNDKLAHVKSNRVRNMSLENLQWDNVNVTSSTTFVHTNSQANFGRGSTHFTGSSPSETSNANINKNKRLANFWEKSVSNNTDSTLMLGQTQNLSRRLRDMTTGSNNAENEKPVFRRSNSENFKPDTTFQSIANCFEDDFENDENVHIPLRWQERERFGVSNSYDNSNL